MPDSQLKVKSMGIAIQNERGRVMSNFAFLESIISNEIAKYYITNDDERVKFANEILEHRFFSFDFKKVLLQNIVKDKLGKKNPDFFKALEGLQRSRNIIAHGLIVFIGDSTNPNIDDVVFRHGGIEYKADQLIKVYTQNADLVTEQLKVIFGLIFVYPNI